MKKACGWKLSVGAQVRSIVSRWSLKSFFLHCNHPSKTPPIPLAFMGDSLSERAFLQGFPWILPWGESAASLNPKDWVRAASCLLSGDSSCQSIWLIVATSFVQISITGWLLIELCLCLWLCFWSHTSTKLLHQVGKVMEKYGKMKWWRGGCRWYTLICNGWVVVGEAWSGGAAQVAQQVSQWPKGWWLKSFPILVHSCVLVQDTEPLTASNRPGSALHGRVHTAVCKWVNARLLLN